MVVQTAIVSAERKAVVDRIPEELDRSLVAQVGERRVGRSRPLEVVRRRERRQEVLDMEQWQLQLEAARKRETDCTNRLWVVRHKTVAGTQNNREMRPATGISGVALP